MLALTLSLLSHPEPQPQRITPIQLALFYPAQLYADDVDVHGVRLSLFVGINSHVRGLDLGLVNLTEDIIGFQAGLLNLGKLTGFQVGVVNLSFQVFLAGDLTGVQVGVVNVGGTSLGAQLGALNMATTLNGVQVGLYNDVGGGHGLQIGVVNMARDFFGVQIGLLNFNFKSALPFCPLVNARF